jgi:hypothetical protein
LTWINAAQHALTGCNEREEKNLAKTYTAPNTAIEKPAEKQHSNTPPLLGLHIVNEPQTFFTLLLTSIGVDQKSTFIYHLSLHLHSSAQANWKKLASLSLRVVQSVLRL